ncbi:hypothetical protein A3E47_02855 [Candidatus Peribacteria bacterium RIFCSPHIGHO2_12_FULL_54_10]|nr:MAG: hypothetical protein A3E47_02855 [Candidatus Peribacteria bacterium RIFCSPHIGHO2_12_FULL_54_10]
MHGNTRVAWLARQVDEGAVDGREPHSCSLELRRNDLAPESAGWRSAQRNIEGYRPVATCEPADVKVNGRSFLRHHINEFAANEGRDRDIKSVALVIVLRIGAAGVSNSSDSKITIDFSVPVIIQSILALGLGNCFVIIGRTSAAEIIFVRRSVTVIIDFVVALSKLTRAVNYTDLRAPVAVRCVAVIALFASFYDAIAAGVGSCAHARGPLAGPVEFAFARCRTAVSTRGIAIIAFITIHS